MLRCWVSPRLARACRALRLVGWLGRGPGRDCPRLYQSLNTVAFAASRALQFCASVVWRAGAGQRRGRLSAQGEGISCAVFGAGACRGVAARHGVQVLSVCNRTCNCGVPQSCGRSARGLGWRRATWWPRGWCGRGGAGRGRAGCSSRCRVGGVRKSGPHALFTPFFKRALYSTV